jgi:type I restriction enzyme S subunit
MIANLLPYPEYKESGSRWLAAVPSHWEVRNLRTLIRSRNERNRADLPLLSVAREKGVFVRSLTDEAENHNVIPEDLSNYKVARAGSLVINKMKAWQGSMGIAPCEGIVSPAYFVFDFAIGNRAFGQALLRSKPYVAHFGQASDGVRVGQWDLTIPGMRQIPVLVPPMEEQAAIVRFLNYANGRLERAIRAKRKVIALLHEQKQVIIHRAVTRGLDPTVPLKPSGIPWLGDIPKHWEVTRLKFEATHIVDCIHATPKYVPDGPFPAIRTADIEPGKVRLSQARRLSAQEYARWTSRLVPRSGDILYSREGERFGIAALVPKEVQLCISQRMMIFRIKQSQLSEFLMWQLNCKHVFAQASCDIIGSTAPHVNVEQIKNYRLVVPPKHEQEQIVAYIAKECSTLNTAINRLEREIELLQEYRTRLVADVVTGKLDVRPAARQLPEAGGQQPGDLSERADESGSSGSPEETLLE